MGGGSDGMTCMAPLLHGQHMEGRPSWASSCTSCVSSSRVGVTTAAEDEGALLLSCWATPSASA